MKLKKLLTVLLAALMLFALTACGKKKTSSESTSTVTSTFKTAQTDAPVIDSNNLYNYSSGIASDCSCEVSEPTVSGDQAVYQITTAKEERFADMTGTYELVLMRDEASGTWKRGNDRTQCVETAYSLNPEEFYSEEYYWAAYPLSPFACTSRINVKQCKRVRCQSFSLFVAPSHSFSVLLSQAIFTSAIRPFILRLLTH